MRKGLYVALALAWFTVGAVGPGACRLDRGARLSLFGGPDDPSVLVWDSRERLLRYAAGSSDTRRFLSPHAFVVPPGTRVVVQECVANAVHPRYQFVPDDALGVQITSGRYRGRYGWISAADVR